MNILGILARFRVLKTMIIKTQAYMSVKKPSLVHTLAVSHKATRKIETSNSGKV